MKFIELILRRPMSVIMLILGVVVFGSFSLTSMPLEYMPDMDLTTFIQAVLFAIIS